MKEIGERDFGELNGRVAELIGEAVLAGAIRRLVREQPGVSAGFGELADKHSARIGVLAREIAESALRTETGAAFKAMPITPR